MGPDPRLVAVLGILWIATLSWAQGEVALEAEAKHLETLLIAPCCWRQPISDHQSADASRMKNEIRVMLQEGKSQEEILDHYVEIYGARILSIPPQEGFNRMSFLMPVFFTIVGVVVVGVVLRKWRHPSVESSSGEEKKAEEPPKEPVLDENMSRRIQEELDALDEY